MTLTKNFLRQSSGLFQVSRFRLWVGIVPGLGYAVVLYGLLIGMRETIRLFSYDEIYDYWRLTDSEYRFYNLFFAFVSIIAGQSLCFSIWFERSRSLFENRHNNRRDIVHDQRFLNWSFLLWFAKVAFLYGLFFGISFKMSFKVIDAHEEFGYVFVHIVIVLFLQSWTSLLRTLKRKAYKWMFGSMLLVSLLSFGISSVNIIDYPSINKSLREKNIWYKYQFELPQSRTFENITKPSLVEYIFLVRPKNDSESKPIIFWHKHEIQLEDLDKVIRESREMLITYDQSKMIIQLCIDKDIEMKYVNQIKKELSRLNALNIAFAVQPNDENNYYGSYIAYTLRMRLRPQTEGFPPDIMLELSRERNRLCQISRVNETRWLINGEQVENKQVLERIKCIIIKEPNIFFEFQTKDSDRFGDYIFLHDQARQAVEAARKEYSKLHFSRPYENLGYEDEEELRDLFPLGIIETHSQH